MTHIIWPDADGGHARPQMADMEYTLTRRPTAAPDTQRGMTDEPELSFDAIPPPRWFRDVQDGIILVLLGLATLTGAHFVAAAMPVWALRLGATLLLWLASMAALFIAVLLVQVGTNYVKGDRVGAHQAGPRG